MLNHRKKELLHKKWTENVNEPIKREIDKEINGPNYLELMKRKRALHKEYLEHTNKKVSIAKSENASAKEMTTSVYYQY